MADQPGFRVSGTSEFESYPGGDAASVDLIATVVAPPAGDGRSPVSVGAVLDRSGSMAGRKMQLLRTTGAFMVRQLGGQDRLGVVTYDSKVTETLPLRAMDNSGKVAATSKVSALRTGDYTNLSGGLFKGLQQQQEVGAGEGGAPGPTRCVMLFTDGLANEGVTDPEKIVATMRRMLDRSPGVKVHTLGFGVDHNEQMLQDIATAGQGVYYFIDREDDIPKAFADALGGLTSVVAQNAELSISPAGEGVFIEKISSGFGVRDGADGSKQVTFGDLCAEERKDVLVRLRIPKVEPADGDKPFPLLRVRLAFVDIGEGMAKSSEMTLAVGRPEVVPEERRPHPEVVCQRERVESAEAMARAMREADNGNFDVALNIVRDRRVAMQATPNLSPAAQDIIDDLIEAESMFEDKKRYASYGSKKMRSIAQAHNYQRSTGPASAMRYATTCQRRMVTQTEGLGALDADPGAAGWAPGPRPVHPPNAANVAPVGVPMGPRGPGDGAPAVQGVNGGGEGVLGALRSQGRRPVLSDFRGRHAGGVAERQAQGRRDGGGQGLEQFQRLAGLLQPMQQQEVPGNRFQEHGYHSDDSQLGTMGSYRT